MQEPLVVRAGAPSTSKSDVHLLHQRHESEDFGPQGIPHQLSVLISSWVFVLASFFLFLGFFFVHHLPNNETEPPDVDPNASMSSATAASLTSLAFHWSCILWTLGFVMLCHWLFMLPGPLDRVGFIGALLKLLASIFFNMNPLSALLTYNRGQGLDWTNELGICLFHLGNMVSVYSMRGGLNWENLADANNLPIFGMWCFLIATTFLVAADTMFYQGTTNHLGTADPAKLDSSFLEFGQLFGSFMLFFGSCIYVHWSSGGLGYCACFGHRAVCTFVQPHPDELA